MKFCSVITGPHVYDGEKINSLCPLLFSYAVLDVSNVQDGENLSSQLDQIPTFERDSDRQIHSEELEDHHSRTMRPQ